MRTGALGGLFAAALAPGCNWAFGLQGTELRPPEDATEAPHKSVTLTYQTATTVSPMSVTLDTPPLAVVGGMVRVGGLPGDADKPLELAALGAAGEIEVPEQLREGTWRLVYVLADEPTVEHEVQWSGTGQHLIEPMFGRIERLPVSPGATYQITIPDVGATFMGVTRTMTTGIWTETQGSQIGHTASLLFSAATSMSGPLGVPEPSRGDQVVLCDFVNLNTTGCAVTQITLLPTGVSTPSQQPSWVTTPSTHTNPGGAATLGPNSALSRLSGALGNLSGTTANPPIAIEIGAAPTLGMYSFTRQPTARSSPLDIVRPVMLTFAQGGSVGSITYVHPDALALPRVMYARHVNDRVASNGAHLASVIQSVVPLESPGETTQVRFAAAVATAPKLGNTALSFDDQPLQLGTTPVNLTWNDDIADTAKSDDHVVTLYKLGGSGALERVHTWAVLEQKVVIDPAIFTAGATYVFEIAGRTGFQRPLVDMTIAAPPFAMASVFTGTFTK